MKLTLRTLLAWLDDTLPAHEVREIGQQVNETPVAKELVDRIHAVTRRRRLTVPHSHGPEATDPNLVAAYLDNGMAAKAVGEYETLCLRSEVHLAEVASVHQILSLLGQRAKVPPEARERMYHLFQGREVARAGQPRELAPPPVTPEHKAAPWESANTRPATALERFGPPALVAVLILLLLGTTYYSLTPPGGVEQDDSFLNANAQAEPKDANAGALELALKAENQNPPMPDREPRVPPGIDAANPPKTPGTEPIAPPSIAPADAMPAATEPAVVVALPVEPDPKRPPNLPADALGMTGESVGVLLTRGKSGAGGAVERIGPGQPLRADQMLVGLEPFHNPLELGGSKVLLISGTIVKLGSPTGKIVGRFELVEGRVVIRPSNPPRPIEINVGEASLRLEPSAGATVGVERVNSLTMGAAEPAAPHLIVTVASGSLSVDAGGSSQDLKGPAALRFDPPGTLKARPSGPLPDWLTELGPSPADAEAGRQFADFLSPDRPSLTGLVEAAVDDRAEIRRLGVAALGLLDQTEMVVDALNTEGSPGAGSVRIAAIGALRTMLARGGPSSASLRDQLKRVSGNDAEADLITKLLGGYSSEEAARAEVQQALVQLLSHPDLGVRELALRNLMAIGQRGDTLGYDPESPEGQGLANWTDLLEQGGLVPIVPKP